VWAGFFQTRLESRFNFVMAAALSALPFAGAHLPLLLLNDPVSLLTMRKGIAGLLILGFAVRLLLGSPPGGSGQCAGGRLMHQIFDASNNRGALVDSLLDGARADVMAEVATVVLTLLIAVVLWQRRPGAFAKRHTPGARPSVPSPRSPEP
jgi:hypothetical protein